MNTDAGHAIVVSSDRVVIKESMVLVLTNTIDLIVEELVVFIIKLFINYENHTSPMIFPIGIFLMKMVGREGLESKYIQS